MQKNYGIHGFHDFSCMEQHESMHEIVCNQMVLQMDSFEHDVIVG